VKSHQGDLPRTPPLAGPRPRLTAVCPPCFFSLPIKVFSAVQLALCRLLSIWYAPQSNHETGAILRICRLLPPPARSFPSCQAGACLAAPESPALVLWKFLFLRMLNLTPFVIQPGQTKLLDWSLAHKRIPSSNVPLVFRPVPGRPSSPQSPRFLF